MQVAAALGMDKTTRHGRVSPRRHHSSLPICSCLPFSIFSPTGIQCERLAVSLAAFLSILVGALALLCLLLTTACLASCLCRRHRHRHGG